MFTVKNLNAGYGSIQVLWDISFEVKDGEVVAILGSNGAGKTTTVRAITGMIHPTSGSEQFNGTELVGKSSRFILDEGIIQVPEGRQLFTNMTVYGEPLPKPPRRRSRRARNSSTSGFPN
ncbi:MAG: ATP-binding cassette domain-containing protein [Sphaerochaetaceae bacterium]|nr:ATP-binding cassette domain-containing protein [Spirochaetales bacterium]MDY5500839.1 ATP-binding cassette domain-containing protein [Sphaerochaetaceae bacterium]